MLSTNMRQGNRDGTANSTEKGIETMNHAHRSAAERELRRRRVLGAAYLAAGVGKCFPAIESTPGRLAQALQANRGHAEEGVTRWLGEHAEEANTVVAVAMASAGCVLLERDSRLADAALAMTLPMLGSFMLILRRALPQVVPIDVAFGGAAIHLLLARRRLRRSATPRTFAS